MFAQAIRHSHTTRRNNILRGVKSPGRFGRLSRLLRVAACLAFLSTAFAWEESAAQDAPSALSARTASSSQINLTWRDNSSDETSFKIERGSSYSGPWTQIAIAAAGSTSFANTGLTASKFYCYRVRASSASGDSEYSNISGDVTHAGSTTPTVTIPVAPSSLSASPVSGSQVNLFWTDNSNNETGFEIERAQSASGPWTQIATVGTGVTAFSSTGLNASTLYYYRVRASNSAGDSANSNTAGTVTPSIGSFPTTPIGLAAAAVSTSQINLSWTDNSSNETGFEVQRATSASGPWTQIATTIAGATSYSNGGLAAATTYYYRVTATNPTGDSGYSNIASATTQSTSTVVPSIAPTGFGVIKASSSQINMWWTDNSNNETGFKIERAFSYGGPWTQVATVGANVRSYSNTGLNPSTFYCYRVRATNDGGDSGYSNISGDTTLAGTTTPTQPIPSAPSSLSASAISVGQINLTWADNANNETGFKIERALFASGPWTQIATTVAGATSYNSTGLLASTLYYYRVRASNSAGDSAYSNQAVTTTLTATTPTTPPQAPSGLSASAISASQINLSWADNSNDETGFRIESAPTISGPWTQFATAGAGVSSYTHSGLLASTLYCYRVRAYNSSGNSGYSSVSSATTLSTSAPPPPPPPSGNLTIPSGHPRLWWNATRLSQARAYFASHPFTPSNSDPFALALAYQMTGNATYARTAINWLVSYQIPAGQASPSAVGSDNARWDGENAMIVFDWCWDQMTASERSTVINNWNIWLAAINQQYWGGVGMEMNNYYWGNLRNSLEWGIASYGENSQAQSFINHALQTRWQNSFVPFAATFGKGGVLQEGPGYGAVSAWYPVIPFASCGLMGRNVWNESPFFKEAVFYMIYATTPAPTTRKGDSASTYELFPFNDSEYPQNGSIFNIRKYHGDSMNTFANQWSSLGVGQYARRWVNMTQANTSWHVKSVDNGGTERSFNTLPLDFFASGTKYLYGRNVWGATSTAVNFMMGNPTGVGHAHRDIGSFQIWRNGKWVSRNTGGYSNSIIGYGGSSVDVSAPSAHNIVLFNGVGQLADSWVKGDPTMVRLEVKPAYIYAAVDLTQIYKANADFAGRVPEAPLNSYIREYVFVRGTETLYICDRIDAASSITATFLLHSETSTPLFSSVAKVGSPSATRTVNEGVTGVGQYRFEYDYPVSGKTYFVRAISPAGTTDSSVVFSATGVGGSFNGTPFSSGIATMNVTDNGPVWNP